MLRLPDVQGAVATGDVLLFRGVGPLSRLVQLWTRSVYSHAGVALRVAVGGYERLCVMEAMFSGVRLVPLDLRLADCERRGVAVDWWEVADPAYDRDKAAAYVLRAWARPYAPLWQLLASFGRLTRLALRWLGRKGDLDPDRYFCSELVAAALRHATPGAADCGPAPEETAPGDLALLPCLKPRGRLAP